ncbi:MAG: peptidoglycan DD-metalloendopeptidase family protein [Alloprevotella sp.]|nr:peptidoglycan DD-metalloendopeptidase family protein [Alloprevotella sp.]
MADKPRRDIKSVKREQKEATAAVAKAGKAVDANIRETERSLNRLSFLQRQSQESRAAVNASQASIDSIDRAIAARTDTIKILNSRLSRLRASYADALRRQQLYPDVKSPLAFIFSANSVSDAYRRMRYLRQYDHWRSIRAAELTEAAKDVERAKARLEGSRQQLAVAHASLQRHRTSLEREQRSTDSIVASLRKEGNALRQALAEKQRRADALDRELDRLIAEEQARIERERKAAEERRKKEAEERRKKEAEAAAKKQSAKAGSQKTEAKTESKAKTAEATAKKPLDAEAEADRKLTGSFESNKGRLLFPVAGRYRITRGFGLQSHPELKHVKTNNSGIDIEVAPGSDARAIFNGRVSAIFRLPGYANIVMIRHGDYISLYANLSATYVSKGQEVKTGQAVGRILTQSEEEGGATTFHFELRRERAKLNPLEWVK